MNRAFLAFAAAALLTLIGPSAAIAGDEYAVDPVHSMVIFRIKHMGVSNFYGRFNEVSGSLTVDEENAANCEFQITVNSASVDTNNNDRDDHLRGPDFFNVREFPEITFRSKSVTKNEDGIYEVTGDLTFHGVTQEVTVNAEYFGSGPGMQGETRCGFEVEILIKRSDFGVSYLVGRPLSDEVKLIVAIEGITQ
ncbi:YceI family protein [Planctomycetota bacterium]|nr:YceI family protein [Planctomycetota bacterium]